MHMREAIDKLMADFNQFLQEHAGFKGCVTHCALPDHSADCGCIAEMAQQV